MKNKMYIGSCCGNKFVILDCLDSELSKKDKADFAMKNIVKYKVDSALFFKKENENTISLEIFEKDGSQSESCGNGMLLVSYLLDLKGGTVKLKNSVVMVESTSDTIMVFMDMRFSSIEKTGDQKFILVKIGEEPHIIDFVDDAKKFNLAEVGESLQKNYPEGVNFDALQKVDESHYLIRTYERGVFAETESCGTGSLSSYLAISHLNDKIYENPIEFESKGGIHTVSVNKKTLKLETLKKFCTINKSSEM
ncbi:MAG: hypothetical protein PHV42_02785 [Candidatus Pacebacteria bacterium]|nr:hypothetical protein [Candidatus Paceibacterota bacterium]